MKFIVLLCLGLGTLLNAGAADPKPITVKVGEQFKIRLRSNRTTGYQWQLAKPPAEGLLQVLRNDYILPKSKLVGAGGTEEWTFKALAQGETSIELKYVRPWETNSPAAQSTNFVVVIKAAK